MKDLLEWSALQKARESATDIAESDSEKTYENAGNSGMKMKKVGTSAEKASMFLYRCSIVSVYHLH